jgi:arylsulfatase A-like enzyme
MRASSLALAAFLLATPGCSPPGKDRPTVVLVVVDQLRKDAADRWMPRTRALAEDGVRFERMRACAPWTYPSVVSLLSGLLPQQHGADANMAGNELSVFSREVPLLPRELGAAGYATAGFVTNPFLHEWNPVHEAFQDYDASFIHNQGARRGHGDLVWTERMYADTLTPAVLEHFRGRPVDRPEFVYVHFIDVHGRRAGPDRWAQAPFEPTYEAATRYVDARIAELHAFFSERSGGNLVFLVTSDHGQDAEGSDDLAVGEGPPWRQRKSSMHEFNLHIPLWILAGDPVPRGVVLEEPCSNVDVAPTLREWLGLPAPPRQAGVSLLGAIRGEAYDGRERTLYAKNSSRGRIEDCTIHDELKLVRYQRIGRQSLDVQRCFDLDIDPREERPAPCGSVELERLLEASGPGRGVFEASWEAAHESTLQQLDAIGYGGEEDDGG